MQTKEQILHDIKQAVLSVDPQAEVVLFGSRARGDYKEESDWDVLVLTEKEQSDRISREKLMDLIYDVELNSRQIITPIIRNKEFWKSLGVTPLYKEIAKDGIAL